MASVDAPKEVKIAILSSLQEEEFFNIIEFKKTIPPNWNIFHIDLNKKAEEVLEQFNKEQPYHLIITTSEPNQVLGDLVFSAREYSIPTLTILKSNIYSLNRVCANLDSEFIAVWSAHQKQVLVNTGIPGHKIFVTGYPYMDLYKGDLTAFDSYSHSLGNGDRGVLSYISTSTFTDTQQVQQEKLEINDFISFAKANNKLAYLRLDLKEGQQVSINHREFLGELAEEHTKGNCFVDLIQQTNRHALPLPFIYRISSSILSNTTTPLIYALLLKKPCALLSYRGLCKETIVSQGVIEQLDSSAGLENWLKTPHNPPVGADDFLNYRYLPNSFDGNNSTRFTALVDYILQYGEILRETKKALYSQLESQYPELINPIKI